MSVHWQGFAVGFLGLTLLDVVVANPSASKGVGGIAAGAGNLARKILSPTVPAFTTTASPTPASSPPAAGQSAVVVPPVNFALPTPGQAQIQIPNAPTSVALA